MTASLRALLALFLLVGFYLLAWGLVFAYLVLMVALLATGFSMPAAGVMRTMGVAVPLVGGTVPAIGAIVHGLLLASRPTGPLPGTVLVLPTEAPKLWETVTELAREIDAPVPDEIRLTASVNAAVGQEGGLFGLGAGTRRMYLGMPLLAGLPTDELKAVLCHELGHYARGHTRFGAVTYRGSSALAVTRERIGSAAGANQLVRMYSGVQRGLLTGYAWLYDSVSLAVRRRQEFEADAAAAAATSPEVMSQALRSVHALALAWQDFHTDSLEQMAAVGRYPDDPFRAFETMLADPDYRELLAGWQAAPQPRPRSRLDSHPSLDQRLTVLAEHPGATAARDRTPALSLLVDPAKLAARVARYSRPLASRVEPWQQWLRGLAGCRVNELARGLDLAVERCGQPASVDGVLELLEAGRAVELSRAFTTARAEPEVPGDVGRNLLDPALFVWIGHGLVRAGRAEWALSWTRGSRLVARDTTPAELFDLVHAAIRDPLEVSRLRLHLAALGFDLAEPAHLADSSAAATSRADGADERDRRRVVTLGLTAAVGAILLALLAVFTAEDEPTWRPPPSNLVEDTGYPAPTFSAPAELPSRLPLPLPSYPDLPSLTQVPLPSLPLPSLPGLTSLP